MGGGKGMSGKLRKGLRIGVIGNGNHVFKKTGKGEGPLPGIIKEKTWTLKHGEEI